MANTSKIITLTIDNNAMVINGAKYNIEDIQYYNYNASNQLLSFRISNLAVQFIATQEQYDFIDSAFVDFFNQPKPVTFASPLTFAFPRSFTDKSGSLHTESIQTQIDLKTTKDKLPLFFDETVNGTATSVFNVADAAVQMDVSANGDYVIRQTKERFNYLTGKTKKIDLTCTNMGVQSGVVKRAGYYNGSETSPYDTFDGIFLEMNGETHNVCVAKSGTVVRIPRSEWDDPLDGTGASGQTVDFDRFLIIRIEFLWLGGGPVTFSIETNDNLYQFHTFKHGNLIQDIYIKSPNQPVRYEIRSTGGTGQFNTICSTVGNYGGDDKLGLEEGIETFKDVQLTTQGTQYLVYATRLKPTYLDVTVTVLEFSFLLETNDDFLYRVLFNPTFSATPTFSPLVNSAVEIGTGDGSITITDNGHIMRTGAGNQESVVTATSENVLRLGSNIDGTPDVIAFTVEPLTNNLRGTATQNWIENN